MGVVHFRPYHLTIRLPQLSYGNPPLGGEV